MIRQLICFSDRSASLAGRACRETLGLILRCRKAAVLAIVFGHVLSFGQDLFADPDYIVGRQQGIKSGKRRSGAEWLLYGSCLGPFVYIPLGAAVSPQLATEDSLLLETKPESYRKGFLNGYCLAAKEKAEAWSMGGLAVWVCLAVSAVALFTMEESPH